MCEATIPGMSWRDIAASAYRAYAASRSASGEIEFRPFDELPRLTQVAWEAAARQVGDCQARTWEEGPLDESRWAGWVPGECEPEALDARDVTKRESV
jgi:hypothetical protein